MDAELRLGHGSEPDTTQGPLINNRAADKVNSHRAAVTYRSLKLGRASKTLNVFLSFRFSTRFQTQCLREGRCWRAGSVCRGPSWSPRCWQTSPQTCCAWRRKPSARCCPSSGACAQMRRLMWRITEQVIRFTDVFILLTSNLSCLWCMMKLMKDLLFFICLPVYHFIFKHSLMSLLETPVQSNTIQYNSSAAIDFTFMKLKNVQKADDVQFSLIKNSKIQINIKNKLSYLASHWCFAAAFFKWETFYYFFFLFYFVFSCMTCSRGDGNKPFAYWGIRILFWKLNTYFIFLINQSFCL